MNKPNNNDNGGQSATADAVKLTFGSIPVGCLFRWKTNLGGQDIFRKTGTDTLRNVTLKKESQSIGTSYFGVNDPVRIVSV